jgi:hypothetical protein
MFVQVIRGRVSDPEQVRSALDRWAQELAPGAHGWLGTTAGVTDDGQFVGVVRFESEEAARANSDRPEQDAWWSGTAALFEGEPSFRDSRDVLPDLVGDPDQAGFVQVMQGGSTDPDKGWELMQQDSGKWADFRPDILGSLAVAHDGGDWTMAMWFTSEEEAREGERKEAPPELQEQMAQMEALSSGPPEFLDLEQPWLYSPR